MGNNDASRANEGRESKTVLVVEDEALIAFDIEQMLRDFGFSDISICATYEKADEILLDRRFDIAVFDLNLDGKLSIPLVERAFAHGTHVVIASGYEPTRVPSPAPSIERILKPCSPDDLKRALEL